MTRRKIIIPVAPKLLAKLDAWSGVGRDELELENYAVQDADFSQVRKLECEGCRLTNVQLAAAELETLQLSDVVLKRIEAAGLRAHEASSLRIGIQDSAFTRGEFRRA